MESWNRAQSIVGTSKGRPENDFYPTPRIATEKLLSVEHFYPWIIEPACGVGAISKVLKELNFDVCSSDLYDYGYGTTGIDILSCEYVGLNWEYASIITILPSI